MRARYYDPDVGRFISEDPIGFAGGDVNLYAYVGNNPILFVDPWGLAWFRPDNHPYLAGREGTIVEPGPIGVGKLIDDYIPAGHTFASMHDNFVETTTEAGIPDLFVNIPSMLPIYSTAVTREALNSVFGLFGSDLFEYQGPEVSGK